MPVAFVREEKSRKKKKKKKKPIHRISQISSEKRLFSRRSKVKEGKQLPNSKAVKVYHLKANEIERGKKNYRTHIYTYIYTRERANGGCAAKRSSSSV